MKHTLLATIPLLLALACGSGGGGDSSTASILSNYSGSTEHVTLDITNAKTVITDIMEIDVSSTNLKPDTSEKTKTSKGLPITSTSSNFPKPILATITAHFLATTHSNLKPSPSSIAKNTQAAEQTHPLPTTTQKQKTITISNDTRSGAGGGFVTANGTVDDQTGDANLDFVYQDYSADGVVFITGAETYLQSGTQQTYTLTNNFLRQGSKSATITGTYVTQFDFNAGTYISTSNFTATESNTGITTVQQNVIESGSLSSQLYKVLGGTVYHSSHGYLSIKSISDLSTSNPNTGTMHFVGKNGSQAQLLQQSVLLIDTDGDDIYETSQAF